MIGAPVIDDEILDNVDSWEHPRERRYSDRQAAFLVVAGDLDNELHSASRHWNCWLAMRVSLSHRPWTWPGVASGSLLTGEAHSGTLRQRSPTTTDIHDSANRRC